MTMTSDPSKMQSMARRRPTGPAPTIRTRISLAAFYSLRAYVNTLYKGLCTCIISNHTRTICDTTIGQNQLSCVYTLSLHEYNHKYNVGTFNIINHIMPRDYHII